MVKRSKKEVKIGVYRNLFLLFSGCDTVYHPLVYFLYYPLYHPNIQNSMVVIQNKLQNCNFFAFCKKW